MKRFLLASMLMALPLAAQEDKKAEPKPDPGPTVQKLFLLKYADPQNIYTLLRVFHASVTPNHDMRALAVDASPEAMAVIEDAIKRLDVPSAAPANIDMTVYLVVGHEAESPAGSAPLPKDLDIVVTQLKNAFAFKSYSLLDVLALRTRTGQPASTTSSGGAMQFGDGTSQPVVTSFSIRSATIASDGATVRIDSLSSNCKVPLPTVSGGKIFAPQDLGIRTDIDIKEGQKVVVGRLGISRDQALFLVMTVKIVP
jgi:hypothetical protein